MADPEEDSWVLMAEYREVPEKPLVPDIEEDCNSHLIEQLRQLNGRRYKDRRDLMEELQSQPD